MVQEVLETKGQIAGSPGQCNLAKTPGHGRLRVVPPCFARQCPTARSYPSDN